MNTLKIYHSISVVCSSIYIYVQAMYSTQRSCDHDHVWAWQMWSVCTI